MLGLRAQISWKACVLAAGLVMAAGPCAWAQDLHGRGEAGREPPPHGYDWRPAPPAVHGFWGQRRWQRYSQDFGTRAVPMSSYGDARR